MRLRALGLTPSEATPALSRALRADCLGVWLPYALADILAAISASRGARPRIAEILRAWGLPDLAEDENDRDTESALQALAGMVQGGQHAQ